MIKFEYPPVDSVVVILSTPRYEINAELRSGVMIHFDNRKEEMEKRHHIVLCCIYN